MIKGKRRPGNLQPTGMVGMCRFYYCEVVGPVGDQLCYCGPKRQSGIVLGPSRPSSSIKALSSSQPPLFLSLFAAECVCNALCMLVQCHRWRRVLSQHHTESRLSLEVSNKMIFHWGGDPQESRTFQIRTQADEWTLHVI